jgi:hypothetical protein
MPLSLSDISEGQHILFIKAYNRNKVASTEMSFSWVTDSVDPQVIINNPPAAVSSLSNYSILFTATEVTSQILFFECALDGALFTKCTSPLNLSDLGNGNHSLKIRAVDGAKNISSEQVGFDQYSK